MQRIARRTARQFLALLLILLSGFFMPLQPLLAAVATTPTTLSQSNPVTNGIFLSATGTPDSSYAGLMRATRTLVASQKKDPALVQKIDQLIVSEKDRLSRLHVSSARQNAYFDLLKSQQQLIDTRPLGLGDRIKQAVGNIFKGVGTPVDPIQIPENPATFHFNSDAVIVAPLSKNSGKQPTVINLLGSAFETSEAFADPADLPTVADVTGDTGEITITPALTDLARALHNNPVEILNYVRSTVSYEPYYGARKGSVGCLTERLCNDVDASSLTIALLRAAGIPARYKKSIAVFPIGQLENLLGVTDAKTAYAALAFNKVPVYTTDGTANGVLLDQADFSGVTQLAVEWVFVETYYDYDERGGNFSNTFMAGSVTSTPALDTLLALSPNKQWIAIDPIVKPNSITHAEVVADTAHFDTKNFWNTYLSYQGTLAPVQKYQSDLLSATGKDVSLATYQSGKRFAVTPYLILPPTLPYYTTTGQIGGSYISPEAWSVLPSDRRAQVDIILKHASDNSVVFDHTFFGSDANNLELNLNYVGATANDQAVIDSYGGIATTPASLVALVPTFTTANGLSLATSSTVAIGDSLVLQFNYTQAGAAAGTDQKFSVAGNSEGIFVSLSGVQSDPTLDTNSHILLRGNTGLARTYLAHVQTQSDFIKRTLDYSYNTTFMRAVVTQNRVLSSVNGTPTTFDFKGLTIDASAYINDYSNVGNYKTHQADFRLLAGLEDSNYEAQLFTDVAGLNGISTVKGLQYAAANPGTYTVYTVSSSTPNYQTLVNSFDLSQNTKANIIADVQKGNTVTTPNKMVTDQNWTGVVYVSLRPDSTGNYAIGEQVSNGGWTINGVTLTQYCGSSSCIPTYESTNSGTNFIYADKAVDAVRCTISTQDYNAIKNNQGIPANSPAYQLWTPGYGAPCLTETKHFGSLAHTYILTTNAAKFTSPGQYNYWVSEPAAKLDFVNQGVQSGFGKFIFDSVAGTYAYYNSGDAYFYRPVTPASVGAQWSDAGQVYHVTGKIYQKLMRPNYNPVAFFCIQGDSYCSGLAQRSGYVLNTLGFPLENESGAWPSAEFTEGSYQQFAGGQIYHEITWTGNAYYVPGAIADEINKSQYCQQVSGQQRCGTGGTFGFPIADPLYNFSAQMVFQDFENGSRIKNYLNLPAGQNIAVQLDVQKIAVLRNFTDPTFRSDLVEGFMDALHESGLYSLGLGFATGVTVPIVVKAAKTYIIERFGEATAVRIAADFTPEGWILTGVNGVIVVSQNWPVIQACNKDPDLGLISNKSPAYYCGKLGANAFSIILGNIAASAGSSLINRLGVTSINAKVGKEKLMDAIQTDDQGTAAVNALSNSSSQLRTNFLQTVNRFSQEDIVTLAQRPDLEREILQSPEGGAITTVDGFVRSGNQVGKLKYRVDPFYSSEFSQYSTPNAFDMPRLLQDGLTKQGFFSAGELGDAIAIYNQKGLGVISNGKSLGEIIFVKELNGTTVLSPRYTDPQIKLPHPYLANGQDVVAAGKIIPSASDPTSITITNVSGHYKIVPSSLDTVVQEFKSLGFKVKTN